MSPKPLIRCSTLALLAAWPLGLAAENAWPTPPPLAPAAPVYETRSTTRVLSAQEAASEADPAAPAPAAAPATNIYNGPVVNVGAPAPTPTPQATPNIDYDPTLLSRRHKLDPATDPHQRGLKLGGPRVGLTYINGAGFDKLKKAVQDQNPDSQVDPYLVQFGWQFEYRMFRTDEGTTAISELIPMVGGLNQGLALPSCAWLVGLRNIDGLEVGVGPDYGMDGGSFLVAVGDTVDLGGINVPLNLAVGSGANRTTSVNVSVGFNL
jgi:hypothetical protein